MIWPIYLYKYRPEENIWPLYFLDIALSKIYIWPMCYLDLALSNIMASGATDIVLR